MVTLTVFTPTYNRAYCLDQLYDSLVRQSNKDFCWLVIDDGSSDNTKELVQSWIDEKKISIQYYYQKNQGMHGAHNTAYSLIQTDLNVCIDSDDYMPYNAVELILSKWFDIKHKENLSGMIALDGDKSGKIIGTPLPSKLKTSTLSSLYQKHNVNGDKKVIYRTDVVKQYPKYPLFKGERFVPLGTLYLMIDQDYELALINEIVCIVEYLPDGSSLNIFKQYINNPRGFKYSRLVAIKYGVTFKQRFKNAIHLVATNIQLKNINPIQGSPRVMMSILAIPMGILLYLYIKIKISNISIKTRK
ncbi:glycosyltransferase family 2 protein [Muricauda ruestringensis]|uniref:Glycosyltransferase family 2 protein n=1 Tax=Flagellimonas aurea TaxID=2915619 RepID=A0ABS3G2I1_9FLAO|nr:glycosyltransferase family 2 protein [Allomuricauda aurea]MBO0353297.1 glycosyltransferase family 2 protein [Allomuricauda aurea]|tara:strand:- start:1121 stop:2026 length:906 start_codon:yes stop_codon:yes gene_type:complete